MGGADGDKDPCWSRRGNELSYRRDDGQMMAAPVATSAAAFSTGPPIALFQTFLSGTWGWRDYDVAPGGKFILNRPVKEDARPIVVVLGFDRTRSDLAH